MLLGETNRSGVCQGRAARLQCKAKDDIQLAARIDVSGVCRDLYSIGTKVARDRCNTGLVDALLSLRKVSFQSVESIEAQVNSLMRVQTTTEDPEDHGVTCVLSDAGSLESGGA